MFEGFGKNYQQVYALLLKILGLGLTENNPIAHHTKPMLKEKNEPSLLIVLEPMTIGGRTRIYKL